MLGLLNAQVLRNQLAFRVICNGIPQGKQRFPFALALWIAGDTCPSLLNDFTFCIQEDV